MSGPLSSSIHWVPPAVFLASLGGSLHCVKMCGGLMTAVADTRVKIFSYHLGRLAGYLMLGTAAGYFGKELFGSTLFQATVPWIAVFTLGLGLIFLGTQLWAGKQPHFQLLPKTALSLLYRYAGGRPLSVGFLSAFLPCGWLHTYVLGALATQNALYGAGFLFAFWLGTLPALSFAPALVRGLLNPLALRAPRISAVILISAGFLSIGSKIVSQYAPHGQNEHSSPHSKNGQEVICH